MVVENIVVDIDQNMGILELEARIDNLLSTAQTETDDIDIFAPIVLREECPICLLLHPINEGEVQFMPCCGKKICSGCVYKNVITEDEKGATAEEFKCAFCRRKVGDGVKALKKLLKKNSHEAHLQMAYKYQFGELEFQSDTKALEMFIKAAELGNPQAYAMIGTYCQGGIVVRQDRSKALEFYEVAAKKGSNIIAHNFLASHHRRSGDIDMCIKHLKVMANAESIQKQRIIKRGSKYNTPRISGIN